MVINSKDSGQPDVTDTVEVKRGWLRRSIFVPIEQEGKEEPAVVVTSELITGYDENGKKIFLSQVEGPNINSKG